MALSCSIFFFNIFYIEINEEKAPGYLLPAAYSLIGVSGGIRTPDPQLRRLLLYPTELLRQTYAKHYTLKR